jgi:membrane-associated protease RseP (regulator of RpoE activity)
MAWWRSLGPVRNLILFLLTVITTYLIGGPIYSMALMTILLAHELGHFLMSRKYHIPVTLPFFIPLPLPPFGTLGAIIKTRGRMTNRRALFDIAVTGPLAGFFFTIPTLIYGLKLSTVVPTSPASGFSLQLGESILFHLLARIIVGVVPQDFDILLHPLAYAGWTGLFVMALNLLPIGQLDGGHVVYALLGRKSKLVFMGALIAFAALCAFFYWGWVLMVMLIIFFGMRHAPPEDDITPIDLRRKLIGVFMVVLFVLAFTPVPFKF